MAALLGAETSKETKMHKSVVAAALLLALTLPAVAQESHAGHGAAAPAAGLPPICLANAPAAAAPMAMQHDQGASPAHADLMAGMDAMNNDMMAGGTASDIDVAFVCSMIPHHQGAIDMARAELKHGDDPWVREMAQAVITAQEKEIADMRAWLEKQPQ